MQRTFIVVAAAILLASASAAFAAQTNIPDGAFCGNDDVCAESLVCSVNQCTSGLEDPDHGVISGIDNVCDATNCCRQGLVCGDFGDSGMTCFDQRFQDGVNLVQCTGVVPSALPASPLLTTPPPIGGLDDSSSGAVPVDDGSTGAVPVDQSTGVVVPVDSTGGTTGGVGIPGVTLIPSVTQISGLQFPGLSGIPGLSGVPNIGSLRSCGNTDVCGNNEVCIATLCVTLSSAGAAWSGTGNPCSASNCCPSPLACLGDFGSVCGPDTSFFRHITCAATGGPNSGVKTGPTPITGTSGLVNGTASIAISAATALVTLLFALNNFLGGLSF